MIDSLPLVSIIIPVYNSEKYVKDTLISINEQTYKNWECIIINDGSNDNSEKIILDYIIDKFKFKYIKINNQGLSNARNCGINASNGDLLQFLDSDDILLPQKIEHQVQFYTSNICKYFLSYTDYITGFDNDINTRHTYYKSPIINTNDPLAYFIKNWERSLSIPPHCFLISKSLFTDHRIDFNVCLPNHEDFECWVQLFKLQNNFIYIDKPLCIYRISDNSMSKKMRLMGEGFILAINSLLQKGIFSMSEKALLRKRKLSIKQDYLRFDLMTFFEKIMSLHIIFFYLKKKHFG
jgi:glycosyltransferase involved in cell wall biosynthesis